MIDHVSIGVRDLSESVRFYEKILAELGMSKLVARPRTVGFGKRYPEFWLNSRPDLTPPERDTGVHVCLRARSSDMVDTFHKTACAAGAQDDGGPGPRPEYGAHYYAAFIRDRDGNRVEVVTFIEPGKE